MPDNSSVCKVSILVSNIKGLDCRSITHCIRVYESMCKPYRTAEIVLLNGDGQVNQLQLEVGDICQFSFMDSLSQTYSMTSYVTAIPEMINADKMREDQVTVGTVSISFMKDRGDIVQASFKNTPVTAAAAAVHSEYIGTPLNGHTLGLISSMGMIAADDIGSYIASGDHPFTTIRKILARATFGGFGTGAAVYFENRYGAVINPLEAIITGAPVTSLRLEQRDTWGVVGTDIFAIPRARAAILASKVYHKDTNSESGGAGAGVKAASAAINIIDQFARIPVMKQAKTMMNGALGQFTGKNGGIQTSGLTDKARNPLSVDPATKQTAEDAFKAKVKDSTNFLVKTTIEAGLDPYFTAGNRVNVTLLAALTNPYNLVQGVLLIADCMHETYFDNRKVSGTTTIRGVALNPLALINGQ